MIISFFDLETDLAFLYRNISSFLTNSLRVPSRCVVILRAAGREERDLGGIYCTVKPGWKRRIPSDLRS